ncbi:hypothetical protein BamMEX5DRAFT_5236 [Burkholderia ambifaria MEX-5]|uniref:Uncharacterized protein n=1 Tax=Burkholderia ambifaria MEX-5 TaxID=396597 RepID=B1TBS0_9BURK|nr:hypothetical protein BamMEX5DRAFT_5236 [Burkholderia ambifaria MEX-5]
MLRREVVQGEREIALSAVIQIGVVFLLVAMKVVANTRIRLTSQLRLDSLASGSVLRQQSQIRKAMLLSEAVLSLMERNRAHEAVSPCRSAKRCSTLRLLSAPSCTRRWRGGSAGEVGEAAWPAVSGRGERNGARRGKSEARDRGPKPPGANGGGGFTASEAFFWGLRSSSISFP